jgi:hypothetical protein
MNSDRQREKLAEACKMVNQVNRSFRSTYSGALIASTLGKVTSAASEPDRNPLADLESLVKLELPDFLSLLRTLKAARDDLGTMYTNVIIGVSFDSSQHRPTNEDLKVAFEKAETACDDFLAKAYTIMRTPQ